MEPANLLLALGWFVVALVPFVSGYSAVRGGWVPVGDNGLIAARVLDTFTPDIQMVGMQTSAGLYVDREVYHPGPLSFWLLAPSTWALGAPGYGLIVGAVAINAVSVLAVASLMRRHRRPELEAGALVLVALVVLGLGGDRLRDPFNPFLGVLPLLVCFVACWGVLSGRAGQLPVAVLAGSFAAQIHISYMFPAGLAVILAFAVVVFDGRRLPDEEARRLWRVILPWSLVVGISCWSGPLIDQFFGTGNLVGLTRVGSVGSDTIGWKLGFDRLFDNVAPFPEWAAGRLPRITEPHEPGLLRSLLGVLCLAALAVVAVVAPRRGRRSLGALAGLALLLYVTSFFLTTRIPVSDLGQQRFDMYRLFWIPVGAVGTGALVWTVIWFASEVLGRRSVGSTEPSEPSRPVVSATRSKIPIALGCAALLVVVPVSVAAHEPLDGGRETISALFGDARVHAARVAELPGASRGVALRVEMQPGRSTNGMNAALLGHIEGLLAQLRLSGIEVNLVSSGVSDMGILDSYLEDHPADGSEGVVVLYRIGSGLTEEDAPEGYRLLSTYDQRDPIERYEGYDGQYFFILVETAVFVKEVD